MRQPSTNTFGEYLAGLRGREDLSLREVEDRTGISNAYLSYLERGQRNPPKLEILQKLAGVYNEPLEHMLAAAQAEGLPSDEQVEAEIDHAFEFVRKHPRFVFGTHRSGSPMTREGKLQIIKTFERVTGLKVLPSNDEEES